MSKRMRMGGLALGAAMLAGSLAPGRAMQQDDPNRALAAAQVNLVRQALQDLARSNRSGNSPTDPRRTLWERRLVDSLRAAGAPREEVVAAIEGHLQRMRAQVRFNKDLMAKGQANQVVVLDAEYQALEAEMLLNQERAR